MDAARRQRLVELFESSRFKGDRSKLIQQSGLTKGRIAQLFDKAQPFGERAAQALASRLHLPRNYFELPSGSPVVTFDEDTLAFAVTYQKLRPEERHTLRLLYQVARAGVHPSEIKGAVSGDASQPADLMLGGDSGLGALDDKEGNK